MCALCGGCPKHVEILLITNKSLFVASSWPHLYLFAVLFVAANSYYYNFSLRMK